ncbi:hypothetical protein OH77DRAFT_513307 [Trametes cingulata]|nr:hypothetical protein OH77DRAFT_513307 [Trametes cingulata]
MMPMCSPPRHADRPASDPPGSPDSILAIEIKVPMNGAPCTAGTYTLAAIARGEGIDAVSVPSSPSARSVYRRRFIRMTRTGLLVDVFEAFSRASPWPWIAPWAAPTRNGGRTPGARSATRRASDHSHVRGANPRDEATSCMTSATARRQRRVRTGWAVCCRSQDEFVVSRIRMIFGARLVRRANLA